MPKANRPAWLDKIMVLPASFSAMNSALTQAQVAQNHFQQIAYTYPEIEIIILPESAYYGHQLTAQPELCDLWSAYHLGKPMHIILGSFRWDGPHYRNSFHWIHDGKIQNLFDKRHAMALIERVPSWFNGPTIHELFFKNFPEITASPNLRPRLAFTDIITFTPYICSELFFREYQDDAHSTTPILSITNDSWCINLYIADLMYLAARMKAIQWGRDVLYVSFKYAVYFDKWGNEIPVKRITF